MHAHKVVQHEEDDYNPCSVCYVMPIWQVP